DRIDARQVIRNDVAQTIEPEIRQRGEQHALAGDRVRQHDVECRDAIGRDDQQVLVVDSVDVADFAPSQRREAVETRLEQRLERYVHGWTGRNVCRAEDTAELRWLENTR